MLVIHIRILDDNLSVFEVKEVLRHVGQVNRNPGLIYGAFNVTCSARIVNANSAVFIDLSNAEIYVSEVADVGEAITFVVFVNGDGSVLHCARVNRRTHSDLTRHHIFRRRADFDIREIFDFEPPIFKVKRNSRNQRLRKNVVVFCAITVSRTVGVDVAFCCSFLCRSDIKCFSVCRMYSELTRQRYSGSSSECRYFTVVVLNYRIITVNRTVNIVRLTIFLIRGFNEFVFCRRFVSLYRINYKKLGSRRCRTFHGILPEINTRCIGRNFHRITRSEINQLFGVCLRVEFYILIIYFG